VLIPDLGGGETAIARLRNVVSVLLWFSAFAVVVVIVASNREYGYAQPAAGAQPASALATGVGEKSPNR
jgi:hypothetical protein